MNSDRIKHTQARRRFAAFAAVLALLFCGLTAVWHFDGPLSGLSSESPALSAAIGAEVAVAFAAADNKPGEPAKTADQDCAFHCDQHGRGLPPAAAIEPASLPKAPKLLNLRDAAKVANQPDGLLEPPRA